MDRSKKILIICYTFPPTSGVGGRRWVKFSKYLFRNGWDVCVISNDSDTQDESSPWTQDAQELKEAGRVHLISNSYPKILDQGTPKTLIQKIKYKLALKKIEKLPGNNFDRSTLWHPNLIPEVKRKINEGYDTILATAAPFRYLHQVGQLKREFPQLKFVADFRDPWTNNTISYGFTKLSDKRFQAEQGIEREVFELADKIICVDEFHVNYIKQITRTEKAVCIPNGFDPDDFSSVLSSDATDKVRFVFAGSIYPKTEYIFRPFFEYLVQLSSAQSKLFHRLKFDFYGAIPTSFQSYFNHNALREVLQFHGKISLEEVGQQISSSDLAMVFLTQDLNYTKSTKFYEYVHLKKKIAVFSSKGPLTQYVEDHHIGFGLDENNLEQKIEQIVKEHDSNGLRFPSTYSAEHYSIPHLTMQLESLLNEL